MFYTMMQRNHPTMNRAARRRPTLRNPFTTNNDRKLRQIQALRLQLDHEEYDILQDRFVQDERKREEQQHALQTELLQQQDDITLQSNLQAEEHEAALREPMEWTEQELLEFYRQQERQWEQQQELLQQEHLELVRRREAVLGQQILGPEEQEATGLARLQGTAVPQFVRCSHC